MHTKYSLRLLFLTCILGIISLSSLKASHIMGGEIYYRCVLQGSYEISLKLYRDCSGSIISSPSLKIYSASLNYTTYIPLSQITAPEEISQVCSAMLPSTTCNSGFIQGAQQILFSAIYTFPSPAPDWEISYESCCRNYALTSGAGGQGMAITATLNNAVTACNNSPYFTATGVPYFCAGNPSQYNHLVIEPDGDSLVYELVSALQTLLPSTNVNYNPGYTFAQPIITAPAASLTFSTTSGQMNFTPASPQNDVVAIRVKEYRNGVMIGSVVRDMQFVVLSCPAGGAVSISPPFNVIGATQPIATDPTYFNACPGVPMSYQVLVTTDTPNVLTVVPTLVPGMTFSAITANTATQTGFLLTFAWTPPLGANGNFPVSISANNNFCFVFGIASASYLIHVTGMDIVSGNEFICPNGVDTIHLATTGGTALGTYQWTGNNILSPTAATTDVIITSMPDTFMVTYMEAGCVSKDTLIVESVGEVVAGSDSVYFCNNIPIQLSASASFHFDDFMCDTTSMFPCGLSPQNIQVGYGIIPSDTNIWWNQFSPFLGYDEDFKTGYLYKAADLQAAGMSAGLINSIAFEVVDKNSTSAYSGLTVGIRCSSLDSLVSNYYPNSLITVFSGAYTTTAGWNVIPFSTPYHWDGVSNIYLSLCDAENNGVTMGGNDDVSGALVSYRCNNTNSFYYADGCAMSSGFRNYYLPNIQFSYCTIQSPITYSWTPASGLSASNISNPILTPPGSSMYIVSATQNGCPVYDSVYVFSHAPQLSIPAVSFVCAGESLTLTNTANTFGAIPVWTELNTGLVLNGNSLTFTPFDTLHFVVIVGDTCGNDTADVIIYYLPPIQTQMAIVDASCMNGNIGAATATASYTNGSISYSWNTSPASTSNSIANLAAGNYTLYVQDSMNCKDTATATIGLVNMWNTSSSVVDVSYNGGNDGSATVTVTPPNTAFLYDWNTTPVQTTPTASNLIAGVYVVTITNPVTNCSTTVMVTVNEPPAISASIKLVNPVSCFGKADAQLEAEVTGGTGSYSYSWTTTPPQFTSVISGLATGSYSVFVKEATKPIFTLQQTYFVPEPALFVATISQFTNTDCWKTPTGTASVTTTGGNGSPSYQWLTNPPQTTQTAINLLAGTYNVIAKDLKGCTSTTTVTLTEPTELKVTNAGITNAMCENANGEITVIASGGNDGFSYLWAANPAINSATLSGIPAGNYNVSVTDAKGCTATLSNLIVTTTMRPSADFSFTPEMDTFLIKDAELTFFNYSKNARSYSWDFGDGISTSEVNPIHRFADPKAYVISLTAFDIDRECPHSMSKNLVIIPNGYVFLANSFSPNDDGINDNFTLMGYNIREISLLIFDRWGGLVKAINNPSEVWDGKDKNGKPCPEGVYTYKITGKNEAMQPISQGGTITLMR